MSAWSGWGLREIVRAHRHSPETLSRGGKDRVADGRRNRGHAGFTDPSRRGMARYEMDFDHRHFVDAQDIVLVEVGLLHAAAVDRDLAFQRRAQSIYDPALNLLLHSSRVHYLAAIDG